MLRGRQSRVALVLEWKFAFNSSVRVPWDAKLISPTKVPWPELNNVVLPSMWLKVKASCRPLHTYGTTSNLQV
jgi:hypothetical protein